MTTSKPKSSLEQGKLTEDIGQVVFELKGNAYVIAGMVVAGLVGPLFLGAAYVCEDDLQLKMLLVGIAMTAMLPVAFFVWLLTGRRRIQFGKSGLCRFNGDRQFVTPYAQVEVMHFKGTRNFTYGIYANTDQILVLRLFNGKTMRFSHTFKEKGAVSTDQSPPVGLFMAAQEISRVIAIRMLDQIDRAGWAPLADDMKIHGSGIELKDESFIDWPRISTVEMEDGRFRIFVDGKLRVNVRASAPNVLPGHAVIVAQLEELERQERADSFEKEIDEEGPARALPSWQEAAAKRNDFAETASSVIPDVASDRPSSQLLQLEFQVTQDDIQLLHRWHTRRTLARRMLKAWLGPVFVLSVLAGVVQIGEGWEGLDETGRSLIWTGIVFCCLLGVVLSLFLHFRDAYRFKADIRALSGELEEGIQLGALRLRCDANGYAVSSQRGSKTRTWNEVLDVEYFRGNILVFLAATRTERAGLDIFIPRGAFSSSRESETCCQMLQALARSGGTTPGGRATL